MGDDPRHGGAEAPGVLTPPVDASPEAGFTDAGRGGGSRGDRGRILRAGILCDGPRLRAWQAWCIEELLEVEGVEPVVVVVVTGDGSPPHGAAGSALWSWYRRHFLDEVAAALEEVNLDEVLPSTPAVRRDSAAAARISEADFDFLLDLGGGPLSGLAPLGAGLERAARHGVWTFRFGRPDKARPPGFGEILRGERLVEASLDQVLVGGRRRRLHGGRMRVVADSYAQTLDHVLRLCSAWPARVCRELWIGVDARVGPPPARALPEQNGSPDERPSPTPGRWPPSNLETSGLIARLLGNYLANLLLWNLSHDDWNVGLAREVDLGALVVEGQLPDVAWLPSAPRALRLADPFGVVEDGRLTVLAERFGHRGLDGEICAVDAGGAAGARASIDWWDSPRILDAPVHRSYPYLFRCDGEIYCVPETFQAREVRLYRARRFPDEWEEVAVVLEDFAAVDPTIFHHEGRWWLLCTNGDSCSQTVLHAWHADDLGGPWHPHTLNPLKTDVRSSRPAGTPFRYDGQLYRPAQDCSERYGGGIALNRVRQLSPTEFAETTARYLAPERGSPYPHGLHTLSLADGWLLVDGMRKRIVPTVVFERLKALLGI